MNRDEADKMCGWGGCTRTKGHPADDRESEGSHADEWPPECSTVEEASRMAADRRFVAVLRRQDGTFDQCSDYAASFAAAEETIRSLYVKAQKNPRDPWHLAGATIEQITFDEYAHELPAHDYVDYD